jgi:hypothetical protein
LGLQSSVLNLWLVIWMHGLQTVLQITFWNSLSPSYSLSISYISF